MNHKDRIAEKMAAYAKHGRGYHKGMLNQAANADEIEFSDVDLSKAICRITVPSETPGKSDLGTGFCIQIDGKKYLVTNQHVIGTPEEAKVARLEFMGGLEGGFVPQLNPEDEFWTNDVFDATIVALKSCSGVVSLHINTDISVLDPGAGMILRIYGHTRKNKKLVNYCGNLVDFNSAGATPLLEYQMDTEDGCSGSPIFQSDHVVVVGLHRAAKTGKGAHNGFGSSMAQVLEAFFIHSVSSASMS